MINPSWDASATLVLPFSPDQPPAVPTTLRDAIVSWTGLADGQQDRALLFVAGAAEEGRAVLRSGEIARLAHQFDHA